MKPQPARVKGADKEKLVKIIKTALAVVLTPISYIAVFTIVSVLGIVYIVTFPIPPQYMQWYIRLACRIILLCSGQWVRVIGKPPDQSKGPYLYLLPHGSALDAFLIGAMIPRWFGLVAAEYNFRIPLWGGIARRFGAIPVERKKRDKAIASMNQAERILIDPIVKNRRSLVVFPEGTRTLTGLLQEFKLGAFHIAKHTGVVMVPCAIIGAFKNYSKRSWLIRPGIITWVWGEPQTEIAHDYNRYTVQQLADLLRRKVGILTGEIKPE